VTVIRAAVDMNPSDAQAQCFLGKLYLLAKDKQAALAQYKTVQPLNAQMARQLYEFIYQDKLLVIKPK
jgi:protein involved in temperature-dependent protein secretion